MAKIYILELNREIDEKTFDFLLSLCNTEKKNEIEKKKLKSDKDSSVVGNALAKYAIKKEFGIPFSNQEFSYYKNKKPFFKNDIFFSVSHSEKAVACAVSEYPVGIDIQKKKNFSHRLASYLGAKNSEEFFTLWTKKEAALKKIGSDNIYKQLKEVDVSGTKTYIYKDYFLSISEDLPENS